MYNRVILLGNITKDVTINYSSGGTAIAKTGIATNRKYKKQSGEQVDETMFIDLTFFGRVAEIANSYLHKGSKVLIEGRLQLEQWVDQSGQKRSKHSVHVEELKMMGGRNDGQGGGNASAGGHNAPQQAYNPQPQNAYHPPKQQMPENTIPEIDIDGEDIPF